MTLLERTAAGERGDDLEIVREDARQVMRAARACLGDEGRSAYAAFHVPRLEAVIANLLPYSSARVQHAGPANVVVRAIAAHSRDLISGAHSSRSYPAHRRLRLLLYSAGRLMTICRSMHPPTMALPNTGDDT
ncbi:hypothetical protein [Streptomyces decoyicus]|uniref:hypothetical protein n=1 Tax=Streptomyces decoyicus TaxID=249567 RepID=UPI00365A0B55